MPGDKIYEAMDKLISDDPQDQLTYLENAIRVREFLNILISIGVPLHKLHLKIGCIIVLLRNLTASQGLCNETRLIMIKLQQNIFEAKAIYSDNSQTFFIPRLPMIPYDSNMPFKYKRKQFPVRLAFSMTINKSQGQTFEKICM